MKRRTRKLVKSNLQLKLVIAFTSLACIAALFQVLLLNYSLMQLVRETVDADLLLAKMDGLLVTNLFVSLAVLLPLMAVFGTLVTHRIAGPVYRFERHLRAIVRGEDPGDCALREGDELQDLCDIINEAVRALKEERPAQGAGPQAGAAESSAADASLVEAA